MIVKLEDTKNRHEYLSAKLGKYSQAVISQEEELTTVGMKASNNPSEDMFAMLTNILCCAVHIDLGSAAGLGQVITMQILPKAMNHW
jgi:hypothetical protein